MSPEKEETRRSIIKYCPPQAYKFYMEQHVEKIVKNAQDRRKRAMNLERELQELQDGVDEALKERFRAVLREKETSYLRLSRAKLNRSHFQKIKLIGKGGFGQVIIAIFIPYTQHPQR